jgi:hypothetical protein
VETVLPQLAEWLRSAASEREGWRMLRHERTREWVNGDVVVTKDE